MSLALSLAAPLYQGASSTVEVPGRYHCSLAGRPYMLDMARVAEGEFRRQAIPITRQQADQSDAPGEQSLSVEELWRRSQDDWSHGAGQTFLDRSDSDNQRFRSSKGVDVWTRWQMSLLPAVVNERSSVNTGLALQVAGTYLYALDGTALLRTQDLATWTTITGTPAAATSVATDGYNVWTAHGASGVYATTRGTGSTASYNTTASSLLGYVKGRLMSASGAALYNITSTTPAVALYTHPNSDWSWVGFAEGQTCIYAAGYSGDKSLIYRTSIKADGTALDIPVVAGELPDGEVVRAIYGYLGFVLIGSDQGIRFCASDEQGNLTIGSLIRTVYPVYGFEGQDRFVWFTWTNYDATSSGLGRLDLSTFIAPLTPAYASDLMATGQGVVRGVVTLSNRRVFAVDGLGFYRESADDLVASGTLDTGLITYGLPDLKTAVYLDVKVQDAVDSNLAYVSVDGGDFTLVGTRSSSTTDPFTIGELSGETFEVRHELVNASPVTAGPVITRYTMRAYPRPTQGEFFIVPVLIKHSVKDRSDADYYMQPDEEYAAILDLRESKQLVRFQFGRQSHTVMVDDAPFIYEGETTQGTDWGGTALLRLKRHAT